jgi:signal transduction histidine kinase/PAS domain-containing protein
MTVEKEGERDLVLRQVIDALPVGVSVMDRAGNIVLTNAACGRLWGGIIHAGEERYPRSLGSWHQTGKPLAPDEWASVRALERGETSLNELLDIETYDGQQKTMQNSAAPIRDENGEIIGAVVVNEDVTERVRSEEALRKSESLLRQAEALGRTGSWEWNIASGDVRSSEQNHRLFFGDEKGRGSTIEDYVQAFHPDDRDVAVSRHPPFPGGKPTGDFEFRVILPNGRVRWIYSRAQSVSDADGKPVRAFGTNTDVTEHREATQELARRTERQAAVARLSMSALVTDSLQALFDEAVGVIAKTVEVGVCAVMEALPHGTALVVRATHGALTSRQLAAANEPAFLDWYATRHGATVLVGAVADDARLTQCERLLADERSGAIAVPIHGKDRPFGVLVVYTSAARAFSHDEVSFVLSMANVLATSIEQRRTARELDEKTDRLRSLSRRLLDAQEAERRAVARELHDDFGAMLTTIKINLQRKDWSAPDTRLESLALVDKAIQQVRDLALDLRPAILDDLGLGEALRWYAGREAHRAGFEVRLDLDEVNGHLPARVATACFRLVQEALTNVVRHADARRVEIALRVSSDALRVEVRDDGKGFDVAAARHAAARGESQGLVNMQERAELAGGELSIDSASGRGTFVRAVLAIPPESDR